MEGEEFLEWAKQFAITDEVYHIIIRAILGAKFRENGIEAHLQDMSKLLKSDDIFDANYRGSSTGYDASRIRYRVTTACIKYLRDNHEVGLELTDIWPALLDFVNNPDACNGLKHLSTAKSIASKDPMLAFHIANNGSALHRYNKGKRGREFFDFLKQLAKDNQWSELQVLYSWMDAYI